MDLTDFEEKLLRRLRQANLRLQITEVQPPQADMVQPLVGPPDAGRLSEEPAALARRQTIAEVLRTLVKNELETIVYHCVDVAARSKADMHANRILQYLKEMQGTEGQDAP